MSGQPPLGIVPVRPLRVADAVAAQLETLIRTEHFGSDGRLPSERELAERFGVGRGSMREAIRALEAQGTIIKNHGVGTFVVNRDSNHYTALSLSLAGDVSALELFEARYSIEPKAAAHSAERRTSQDVDHLTAIVERSGRPGISPDEFTTLDFEFHRLIVQSSRNRLLSVMYDHLRPHHRDYSGKAIAIPNRRETAHHDHRRILEAIARSDPSEASKAALAHLRKAEEHLAREIAKSQTADQSDQAVTSAAQPDQRKHQPRPPARTIRTEQR